VESKPCTVLQSQDMIVHGRDLRALPQTKKVPHQHKQVGSISAKIIVRRLDGRMAFVPEGQRDRIARARQSAKRASFETVSLGFLRLRVGSPLARPWRQEIDYHTAETNTYGRHASEPATAGQNRWEFSDVSAGSQTAARKATSFYIRAIGLMRIRRNLPQSRTLNLDHRCSK